MLRWLLPFALLTEEAFARGGGSHVCGESCVLIFTGGGLWAMGGASVYFGILAWKSKGKPDRGKQVAGAMFWISVVCILIVASPQYMFGAATIAAILAAFVALMLYLFL
jgi:hypothetical protein